MKLKDRSVLDILKDRVYLITHYYSDTNLFIEIEKGDTDEVDGVKLTIDTHSGHEVKDIHLTLADAIILHQTLGSMIETIKTNWSSEDTHMNGSNLQEVVLK
jgi:hypothetical protein